MRNTAVYIGFTLLSDNEEGNQKVSGFTGHLSAGMDALQVTALQELLLTEFKDDLDAFLKPIQLRLVELGYAVAVSVGGEDPANVEKNRNVIKKGPKKTS